MLWVYNQSDTGTRRVFTIKTDIKTLISYVYQCKYGPETESAERERSRGLSATEMASGSV